MRFYFQLFGPFTVLTFTSFHFATHSPLRIWSSVVFTDTFIGTGVRNTVPILNSIHCTYCLCINSRSCVCIHTVCTEYIILSKNVKHTCTSLYLFISTVYLFINIVHLFLHIVYLFNHVVYFFQVTYFVLVYSSCLLVYPHCLLCLYRCLTVIDGDGVYSPTLLIMGTGE